MTMTSKLDQPASARSVVALCLATAIASFGATAASATVVHTPQSIECSKQADAKGLHGKEREKFRAECKHNAKTSPAIPTAKPAPVKAPN